MKDCTRSIFGVPVRVFRRSGAWWWRPLVWVRQRRGVGPYDTRAGAIRDCARMLHAQPYLRTARPVTRAGVR